MERTTRTHTGKTPIPGMASAIKPGKIAHRRPRIRNKSNAVPRSINHCIGGASTNQKEKKSETAAIRKATACRLREGRRTGASTSVGVKITGGSVGVVMTSLAVLKPSSNYPVMGANRKP